jgi:glycosyltransferase involved in cell wall biosynthesis
MFSETLFSLQVAVYILRHKTDVVLTSTPYMLLGPLGLAGSRLRGAKFVWDVRDLTWQYVKAIGRPSYGLDALLERLMKFTARKTDALVTATNGQLPYFERRPEHSLVVPNGLSDSMLAELGKAALSALFGESKAKVLYAGLLGYAQGLTTLIRTAHLLPNIELRLVGDGPERAALEAEARMLGLSNVHFEGYVSFNELIAHYAWADILVAHLRDNSVFEIAQPSKLWEYMATGKPVIYAGKGEAVSIIQEYEAGVCVPPDNPEALAEAIRGLVSDPARAIALGKRGREFVENHRRRNLILERLAELLDALVPGHSRAL